MTFKSFNHCQKLNTNIHKTQKYLRKIITYEIEANPIVYKQMK